MFICLSVQNNNYSLAELLALATKDCARFSSRTSTQRRRSNESKNVLRRENQLDYYTHKAVSENAREVFCRPGDSDGTSCNGCSRWEKKNRLRRIPYLYFVSRSSSVCTRFVFFCLISSRRVSLNATFLFSFIYLIPTGGVVRNAVRHARVYKIFLNVSKIRTDSPPHAQDGEVGNSTSPPNK